MSPDLLLLDRLAGLALAFGRVERATFHEDGIRRETDAEHTVMLGLVAVEVATALNRRWLTGFGGLTFNVGRVAHYALVHDLVEARTPGGDTNSFDLGEKGREDKARREAVGLARLREEFGGTAMLGTIEEYEMQTVPEAQLVRYLDKITPKLTHALNGCAAIKAMGKALDDLRRAHREQGAALAVQYPELAPLVGPIFDAVCRAAGEAW